MATQQEIDELQLQLSHIEDKLISASKKPQRDYETVIDYQANRILELEQENKQLRDNFRNLRKTYGSVLKQLKDEIKDLSSKFISFEENLEDSQQRSLATEMELAESKHESDELVIKSLLQSISELENESRGMASAAADPNERSTERLYYGMNDRNQQLAKNIQARLDQKRGAVSYSGAEKQSDVLYKLGAVEEELNQIDERVEGLQNSLADSLSG